MAKSDGPVYVFITYQLEPGVTMEEFREFSKEVDQPIASVQPGVIEYEHFEIEGADEGKPDVDIVEVIVAESWDAWLEVDNRPEMKPIFEGFLRMAKDDTVKTFYGSKIEPKDG